MVTSISQTNTLKWIWDRIIPLVLAIIAVAAYLPGIQWGLPQGTPGRLEPWGPDEIAPMGPLHAAHSLLAGTDNIPTKYPLLHYLVVAVFYVPYMGGLILAGHLANPSPGYPYGFADPVAALQTLTLIARGVSLLMATGTVVAAYFTTKTLWDRLTAALAGVFVLLMYPLFYYGKTSNVDVPSLFWMSLFLLLAARVLQQGWTVRRAVWMGTFAALAVATKDQSYASVILLPPALLLIHIRSLQARSTVPWSCLKAPLAGLVAAAGVYAFTSGLVIRPKTFLGHWDFITGAWVKGVPSFWYYRYSDDLPGYLGLMAESLSQIVDTIGWPLFVAALVGMAYCVFLDRTKLVFLLTIPVLFFGVIFPVRHTAIRFMLPVGYVLAWFAARALAVAIQSHPGLLRGAALATVAIGCAFQLARAADLTQLMWNDPRYQASAWFKQHAGPGDRVAFFESVTGLLGGRINRMPYFQPHVQIEDAARTLLPGSRRLDGEFVLTLGPEDQDLHWFCPAITYRRLRDGSLGYDLGATFQQRALFAHSHLDHHINPRVELFVRRDRAAELGLVSRQDPAR